MTVKEIVVIGAGAGGLVATGRAAECGGKVILLEKSEQPGKKMLISGQGRCNISNSRDMAEFITAFGPNGRFLYSAFSRFFRQELVELLARYGVETKTERGGRLFPDSDKAGDVVGALMKYASAATLIAGQKVSQILVNDGQVVGVKTEKETFRADAAVIATGGASYPGTGSSGDGFRMAEALGHTIVKLRPALVPLVVKEIALVQSMQGVALKNIRLTSYRCEADKIPLDLILQDWGRGITGKKPPKAVIESRMGELMITHFGLGGPLTMLMGLPVAEALEQGAVSVAIDLKPALSLDKLRLRLQRDFDTFGKRSFQNLLSELLPQKMIRPFVDLTGIDPFKCGGQITASEREVILANLKCLRFNITSTLPLTSAVVTAGGGNLKEIDPRTMESKLIKGLYFCGEVMDIDADTGGYNLQAAFSSGYLAGESAAGA
ncbi:hypothetical protein B1776_00750 [Dehalococcoides mccartyi]|uniref:NAD(P)/FAD-dependent oxidoreductase n=1 Tax=Dehalococcoides mccartyi TaxID=61435 RepID=UPI00099D8E1A|nr:NAD(P)/FAD-dependent oxidoreductase [Dehalococcoides mccartyi]AQX74116.1 hypothetical protein B1776_00750 [Dehalococcoides mccartyi]